MQLGQQLLLCCRKVGRRGSQTILPVLPVANLDEVEGASV